MYLHLYMYIYKYNDILIFTYIYIYNHCKQSGAQRMAKTFVKGLQKKTQSKQIETH